MKFFGTKLAPQSEPGAVREENAGSRTGSQDSTVIDRGIVVTGRLSGEGMVQIGGMVGGEVSVKGHLTITDGGKVKGPVEADVIRVAGLIEGSVLCRDHLQLERTGKIEGDVTTGTAIIENGGLLNGRITMTGTPKQEPPAKEPGKELGLEDLKFGRNYTGGDGEDEDEKDESEEG